MSRPRKLCANIMCNWGPLRLKFSPDGTTLAAAGGRDGMRGRIVFWSASDGTYLKCMFVSNNVVDAIAFSRKGNQLAFCPSPAKAVTLIGLSKLTKKTLPIVKSKSNTVVSAIDFSRSGVFAAVGCWDTIVKIVNIQRQKLIEFFPKHEDNVDFVAFASQDRLLISATTDCIRMWDIKSRKLKLELNMRTGQLFWRHCFSCETDTLISVNDRGRVQLVKVNGWKRSNYTLRTNETKVSCIATTNDGKLLAIANLKGTIEIVTARNGARITQIAGRGRVLDLCFSVDKTLLAVLRHKNTKFQQIELYKL